MLDLDHLCRRAAQAGLAVRGALHPEPGELVLPPGRTETGTIVLLGFTGSLQWGLFQQSSEALDGLSHPLDRWSKRIIGALAGELHAVDFYPSGEPRAPLPFQRLALRAEPVHASPIGLLIHEAYGLWHAYRGGLWLRERIAILRPARQAGGASPCQACAKQPCLSACPVRAFASGTLNVAVCARHSSSAAGKDCREMGCLARSACPVGKNFRYSRAQAGFHMRAFLNAVTKEKP